MVTTTVTQTRTLSIPDDKVAEARKDLRLLNVPGGGNLCYNDGHFARSLERKWGMTPSDLERLVGTPTTVVVWEYPNAAPAPEVNRNDAIRNVDGWLNAMCDPDVATWGDNAAPLPKDCLNALLAPYGLKIMQVDNG